MVTSFACVLFRTGSVGEPALSHGFAVALAGFSVFQPILVVGEVRSLPGWSAAFYRSGLSLPGFEEFDHACDVFEEDLPPGLAVRDAAADDACVVYALVFSDDVVHDDAWKFGGGILERHFVREGDEGLEAGVESLDDSSVEPLSIDSEASDAEIDSIAAPHRGSAFLSRELRAPVLPALVGALFDADRRVRIQLVDPSPESIAAETRRLNEVLRRRDGRGTAPMPPCRGVACPPQVAAFAAAYDFEDPSDPSDLYRELSIGRIEGTLHFMRASDVAKLDEDAQWQRASREGVYPLATLGPSALGGVSREALRVVGLASDGESLVVGSLGADPVVAGPTFGELLRYLSVGFKRRDEVEEDLIGALMLRARTRTTG